MYTVISAKGVSKEPQSRWGDLSIGAMAVNEIYNTYREVYLTLQANYTPDPIYVDFSVFRAKYSSFTGTIDDMLTDNGNETFDTMVSLPVRNTAFVYFQDMFRAGYNIDITARNSTPDADGARIDKIDLRVYRREPETSMQDVYDYCMVNVNGYWHMTDTDGDYLYVFDAARTNQRSRHNTAALLSFRNVGKVKHIPITPAMVYKQNTSSSFYDKTYVQIDPSIDIENKTVLLVLGGYLVKPNKNTFFPVGNNAFGIDLKHIPLLERYYESRGYLDLSSLGLSTSDKNESIINATEFYSDSVIFKYLTLSQSFIVIVDTPELFFNELYIQNCGFPGMFNASFDPKYPLVTGRGRVSIYWKQHEDNVYSINVVDSYLNYRLFNHLPHTDKNNVAASAPPFEPEIHSSGHLLEIGTDYANP